MWLPDDDVPQGVAVEGQGGGDWREVPGEWGRGAGRGRYKLQENKVNNIYGCMAWFVSGG